ncbi:MAG: Uma2 family endonuclease [Saprospiraceae bacterium]
MAVHENFQAYDETLTVSDYEIERNKPMPSFNHGSIQANLIALLYSYKNYRIVSELSLDLSDWPSVPDLSIYSKRPLDFKNDLIKVKEAPLCVVEIISPTQSLNELTDKAREYFAHGVKSCWLVLLPLTTICVFSSPDDCEYFRADQTLQDKILDISLPLKEVFE